MILWAAIVLGTLVACEVAFRIPLGKTLVTLNGTSRRAAQVVGSSAISDTWKEKILPSYAWRIMKASLMLFACLLAIALPVVGLVSLASGSLAQGSAALMRPLPLVGMIALGFGYVMLRRRLTGP